MPLWCVNLPLTHPFSLYFEPEIHQMTSLEIRSPFAHQQLGEEAEYFGPFPFEDGREVSQANAVLHHFVLLFISGNAVEFPALQLCVLDLILLQPFEGVVVEGEDGLVVAGGLDAVDRQPFLFRLLQQVFELLHPDIFVEHQHFFDGGLDLPLLPPEGLGDPFYFPCDEVYLWFDVGVVVELLHEAEHVADGHEPVPRLVDEGEDEEVGEADGAVDCVLHQVAVLPVADGQREPEELEESFDQLEFHEGLALRVDAFPVDLHVVNHDAGVVCELSKQLGEGLLVDEQLLRLVGLLLRFGGRQDSGQLGGQLLRTAVDRCFALQFPFARRQQGLRGFFVGGEVQGFIFFDRNCPPSKIALVGPLEVQFCAFGFEFPPPGSFPVGLDGCILIVGVAVYFHVDGFVHVVPSGDGEVRDSIVDGVLVDFIELGDSFVGEFSFVGEQKPEHPLLDDALEDFIDLLALLHVLGLLHLLIGDLLVEGVVVHADALRVGLVHLAPLLSFSQPVHTPPLLFIGREIIKLNYIHHTLKNQNYNIFINSPTTHSELEAHPWASSETESVLLSPLPSLLLLLLPLSPSRKPSSEASDKVFNVNASSSEASKTPRESSAKPMASWLSPLLLVPSHIVDSSSLRVFEELVGIDYFFEFLFGTGVYFVPVGVVFFGSFFEAIFDLIFGGFPGDSEDFIGVRNFGGGEESEDNQDEYCEDLAYPHPSYV